MPTQKSCGYKKAPQKKILSLNKSLNRFSKLSLKYLKRLLNELCKLNKKRLHNLIHSN